MNLWDEIMVWNPNVTLNIHRSIYNTREKLEKVILKWLAHLLPSNSDAFSSVVHMEQQRDGREDTSHYFFTFIYWLVKSQRDW